MWRNRSRTAITTSAVFFAILLAVVTSSFQVGVFDNLIKNVVGFYNGYVQVHKMGFWDEQILDNVFENKNSVQNKILSNENIESIAPRLESFALVATDSLTKGCLVVGIAPARENEITKLKSKIISGSYLKDDDPDILISEGLADRMRVKLYDTIVLLGQGYHGAMATGKYRIKGMLKFGSPELNKQSLYLNLPEAQSMFGAQNKLTSYVLNLKSTKTMDETVVSLRNLLDDDYEVMTWEEMMPDVSQHIKTDNASMYIIFFLLYILVCFGIFGTLLMMMVERKYELGMLVAIGMKKIKLSTLLILESLFTVITGCLAGILVSLPVVYYLKWHPIRFTGDFAKTYQEFGFEPIFPASTDSSIFIQQGLIVLILGLVLSLYPVLKVFRLNPIESLKK
ncbi:ABC transporter permease [Gaetbulibacter aestuarii]|uniref:FtsX-like permease family protein n=1 Tax=Gaetbulibacter aestuarii TaxID=1502358 RepID=A0ABW7MZK5_9FLAO